MKINELKVGDRVKIKYIKFKENDPDCSYGYITKLSDEHGFFKVIINGIEVTTHYDWFVAFMLPITYVAEYKEIKIDHSLGKISKDYSQFEKSLLDISAKVSKCYCQNSIKLSQLKIGDKIKFKGNQPNLPEPCECIGTIQKIYSDSFIVENNIHVSEKNIICKLEDIYVKGYPAGYKEIPIEKELKNLHPYLCPKCGKSHGLTGIMSAIESRYCRECCDGFEVKIPLQTYWLPVLKTVSHPYNIPETTYHCPICDKKLWGLCGMPIKQIANEPCKECKEKPAPKSFKFDFIVDKISGYKNSNTNTYHSKHLNGKTKDDKLVVYPAPEWIDFNKEYTIEIKEKE